MRTTVLMVILVVVSGFIVLARGDANGIHRSPVLQDPSPPSASIVPDQLDFGDQVVGRRSKAKRITVTNAGGKPLYISSVTGDGDNWSDFSVVNDTCTGATVAPNRSCIIDVAFSPSDTDERNASLSLGDNAPDSPQTLSLTGNGINSQDVPPFISR